MNLSYPMTMDIWDEATADLTIDDLKIKLQEAIDVENYEEAAKIQKQIDNKK
jgi:protein-arginine kinase activator protein McsA